MLSKRQAQLDALTGCYNRRKFDEALRQEIKRAGRVGQPLASIRATRCGSTSSCIEFIYFFKLNTLLICI